MFVVCFLFAFVGCLVSWRKRRTRRSKERRKRKKRRSAHCVKENMDPICKGLGKNTTRMRHPQKHKFQ